MPGCVKINFKYLNPQHTIMKKYTFLFIFSIAAIVVSAQSYYAKSKYDKEIKPGLALQLPYSPDVAEGTIIQKLKEIGYEVETKGTLFWKKNKINGYYEFNSVNMPTSNGYKALDLYFNVERKSRKESDQSIMYLLVSSGNKNFISPDTDSASYNAARRFLNGFVSRTAAFKLNLDVETQEKVVLDAEKKLNDLQTDADNMRKKIAQLQQDLVTNVDDQEKQFKEIEMQRVKLEELKKQVKN